MVIILIFIFFANMGCAETPYTLDTFGSERFTDQELQVNYGSMFSKLVEEWDWKNPKYDLFESIQENICRDYGFAYVNVSLITYFNQPIPHSITVDVVEREEQDARMPFLENPTDTFGDPSGLFKIWEEYVAIGMELQEKNELTSEDFNDCSVLHTIFGHRHPRLTKYKDFFQREVAARQSELECIFLQDRNENKRAVAAFLLAYLSDGKYLVELLQKRLNDASKDVRNNVMRVYVCIAQNHPEIALPVERIVQALNYPNTTDRNKASAILFMLARDPIRKEKYRQLLMQCVPLLIKMAALKQPNNRDFAQLILKELIDG